MTKWIWFLLPLLLLINCSEKPQRFDSQNFELINISEGIYAGIHKLGGKAISNSGIIDLGEETVIFDSFLDPGAAEELIVVSKLENLSPIKYVVNSHSHNDHIRGNQVFNEDVIIISTSRTLELIAENEPKEIEAESKYAPGQFEYYDSLYRNFNGDKLSKEYEKILIWRPYFQVLAESKERIKSRLPTETIDSSKTIIGRDKTISLITKGMGHSESDLVLFLAEEKVLFAGDLIFNQYHPYFGNGDIDKWKEWLGYLENLDIETIIPGHGPIGGKFLILQMLEYISTIENLALDLSEKEEIPDLATIKIPEKYENWMLERFFVPNLLFAIEYLKNKANSQVF